MQDKKKPFKKPGWLKPHPCAKCGAMVSTLTCPYCGKPSVKK